MKQRPIARSVQHLATITVLASFSISCGILWGTETGKRRELFGKLEEYVRQHTFASTIENEDTMAMLKEELSKFVTRHSEMIEATARNPGDPYEQGLAVFALAFFQEKKSVSILTNIIAKTPHANVKRNALGSIGVLAEGGAIGMDDVDMKLLFETLKEPDYEILISTLYALQNLIENYSDAPEIIERARKLLFHPHPLARNEALILLAKANDKPSYKDVLKLRFDNQPIVRKNVAVALGRLKENEAVPDLIELLRDPNNEVVSAAHLTLIRVTGNNYGSSYQVWKERFQAWKEEQLRYYTCPVHSNVKESSEIKCEICGRKLMLVELVYLCEDHPLQQSKEPGVCPICEKELILTERPPEPDTIYYCPMHREIIKFEEGKCPICKMQLKKRGEPDGGSGEGERK